MYSFYVCLSDLLSPAFMDDFILVFLYRLTNEANTYANKDDNITIGTQLIIKGNRLYYCRGPVKLAVLYI